MNDGKALYVISLCAAASMALIWKWRHRRSKLPFPPGPKGVPLLGNMRDVPRDVPIWRTFASIAQNFDSDVIYLKLLTTKFIVLNSPKAVSDLTEKRSNIYSDRPQKPMLNLMGIYDWAVSFMEYGSQWRNGRRLLHEFLSLRAVTKFDGYQRKHTYRLLSCLADSPDGFFDHAEFAVAGLVMEMTYDIKIKSNQDRFLRAIIDAGKVVKRAMVPGAFLVDTLPILKYVPEWLPGAGFKTFARVARGKFDMAVDEPLAYAKDSIKSDGSGNVSIALTCFDRAQESKIQGFDDSVVRAVTGTMYVAAVGNTTSLLHMLFLTMALNPHVAKKAQEELDRLVGNDRLPDFSDHGDLPYISAIMKELFRWGCPTPIGIPKRVMEDDIYNGYFIPAGATVVENIWAMFYDETTYPAPYTFNPERYLKNGKLDPSVRDPEERIFGAGRRLCPGKHFALRHLFLNTACILALYDIEAPVGENLEPKFFEEGFVRYPTRFKCTVKPRSEESLKLVQSVRDVADY